MMKHYGPKNLFALLISLLVLASLACSMTNKMFQPEPSRTPKATASKTKQKHSPTPGSTLTPTRRLPPAFLTRSAVPKGTGQISRLATITPLPGPTEEMGIEAGTESSSSKKSTSTRTGTSVVSAFTTGTPFTPTATNRASSVTVTSTTGADPTSTAIPSCGSTYNHQYESDLLGWINEEREGLGLNDLTRNKKLDLAALRHSLDMACTQDWFDQKGSDGSTIYDRISDADYSYSLANQTIYAGSGESDDPKSAFDTWKSLSTSKSIMFDDDFTEIGISYVHNDDSTYGGYFTAVYATP
jgi:uncharacterized protein YkwD